MSRGRRQTGEVIIPGKQIKKTRPSVQQPPFTDSTTSTLANCSNTVGKSSTFLLPAVNIYVYATTVFKPLPQFLLR